MTTAVCYDCHNDDPDRFEVVWDAVGMTDIRCLECESLHTGFERVDYWWDTDVPEED